MLPNDAPPVAVLAIGGLGLIVAVRLFALVAEQLDRPAAPRPSRAAAETSAPLRPPSWFAPEHERLLYHIEMQRTETELVQSHTTHTQATTAFMRAAAELADLVAASAPAATPPGEPPAPTLTRDHIVRLVGMVPDLDDEQRARLVGLLDAYIEETRR